MSVTGVKSLVRTLVFGQKLQYDLPNVGGGGWGVVNLGQLLVKNSVCLCVCWGGQFEVKADLEQKSLTPPFCWPYGFMVSVYV